MDTYQPQLKRRSSKPTWGNEALQPQQRSPTGGGNDHKRHNSPTKQRHHPKLKQPSPATTPSIPSAMRPTTARQSPVAATQAATTPRPAPPVTLAQTKPTMPTKPFRRMPPTLGRHTPIITRSHTNPGPEQMDGRSHIQAQWTDDRLRTALSSLDDIDLPATLQTRCAFFQNPSTIHPRSGPPSPHTAVRAWLLLPRMLLHRKPGTRSLQNQTSRASTIPSPPRRAVSSPTSTHRWAFSTWYPTNLGRTSGSSPSTPGRIWSARTRSHGVRARSPRRHPNHHDSPQPAASP